MEQALRVNAAGVQEMAGRWEALAGDLSGGIGRGAGLGLSCQPSAAAMNAGHADVTAGTAVLAARLLAAAAGVAVADTGYAANEANSTAALAAVADPVIVV
jgi:hypothetical protein